MGPTLIRDGAIVADDDWRSVTADAALPASGRVILELEHWRSLDGAAADDLEIGVRLPNTVDVEELAEQLPHWSLIELQFPTHADGRAYSQARVLRDRLSFSGELRASGDVLRDQLHYLLRCGCNAFVLAAGRDPVDALAALSEFSDHYQPACDQPQTVFSRRAAAF